MKAKVLATFIGVVLSSGCHSKPLGGNFRELHLDPQRHFVLAGQLPLINPPGNYYEYMNGSFIDMLNHRQGGGSRYARIALSIDSGRGRKLLDTLRREPLLQGPFGRVFLEKMCFFAPPESGYRSYLQVSAYMNDLDIYVPPIVIATLPATAKLTSASFIRVVSDGPTFVMASSDYSAEGRLEGQGLSHVKAGGELISGQTLTLLGPKTSDMPDLSAYELPKRLNFVVPQIDPPIVPSAVQNEMLSALIRRYDFDRYLHLDTFKNAKHTSSVLLEPVVMPEDASLNAECDEKFSKQLAAGQTITR